MYKHHPWFECRVALAHEYRFIAALSCALLGVIPESPDHMHEQRIARLISESKYRQFVLHVRNEPGYVETLEAIYKDFQNWTIAVAMASTQLLISFGGVHGITSLIDSLAEDDRLDFDGRHHLLRANNCAHLGGTMERGVVSSKDEVNDEVPVPVADTDPNAPTAQFDEAIPDVLRGALTAMGVKPEDVKVVNLSDLLSGNPQAQG